MRSHCQPRAVAADLAGALTDPFVDQLWSALMSERRSSPPPARGLPLASLVAPGHTPLAYCVVTPMDDRGRLADRSPLQILRWRPGLPVAMSVLLGAVVIVPDHDGPYTITRQGYLRLPASVRHACRLEAGDRLLLMACPGRDLLVAYTMAALQAMLLTHHAVIPIEAT